MRIGVDDATDRFVIGFDAVAEDKLIETADNHQLHRDTSQFSEFWAFQRSASGWLLDSIQQSTFSPGSLSGQLQTFAEQNGYYFSADMGWLLIPKRGQLFDGAVFGKSDINNHIIGTYRDQMILQLYSYRKNPDNYSNTYTVAQTMVLTQKVYAITKVSSQKSRNRTDYV